LISLGLNNFLRHPQKGLINRVWGFCIHYLYLSFFFTVHFRRYLL